MFPPKETTLCIVKAGKLLFLYTTLTTDQKLKRDEDDEPAQTTGNDKGLLMYTVLNNE